jgi:hypothetical protein
MAIVFGFTPIELVEGIRGEDFEKFWLEEYGPLGIKLGWKSHLFKADRGVRKGKYAVIWEIPSVESRDRFSPEEDQLSEVCLQLLGPEFELLNKKLDTFVVGWPNTDYIELG